MIRNSRSTFRYPAITICAPVSRGKGVGSPSHRATKGGSMARTNPFCIGSKHQSVADEGSPAPLLRMQKIKLKGSGQPGTRSVSEAGENPSPREKPASVSHRRGAVD